MTCHPRLAGEWYGMSLMWRALFVVSGIIAGSTAINYYVFGNTGDLTPQNARLGAWRDAQVRTACFGAMERPEDDPANPKFPAMPHRIGLMDHHRAVEVTAALHCYLVTQRGAVCERNNRAYIVDYIGKYFGKMDQMLGTAKAYGDDEVRNVRDVWNSRNNRAITAALDDHIRNGRLIKSDFGWSVPAQLETQLASNAPDMCAKERPWVAVKVMP
jgi:hypothetical protein